MEEEAVVLEVDLTPVVGEVKIVVVTNPKALVEVVQNAMEKEAVVLVVDLTAVVGEVKILMVTEAKARRSVF